MATIKFKNELLSSNTWSVLCRSTGPLTTSSTFSTFTVGTTVTTASANSAVMTLYQGTRPADFTGLTNVSTYESDALITFDCSEAIADLSTTTNIEFQIGRSLTNATTATASGIATWFILRRNDGTGDLVNLGAIMGDVGVTGSGADLVMDSTTIVSGNPYRTYGFYINFPTTWTV